MITLANVDRLRSVAPSVFADRPYFKVSDKYTFIPTINVVETLLQNGFVVTNVRESYTRNPDRTGYVKHQLRLRLPDGPQFDEGVPEVLLTNSHDTASAFKLMLGIFRFVCSNGLVIGSTFGDYKVTHRGRVDDIVEAAFEVVDDFPKALEQANTFRSIHLTAPEQEAFASAALTLRYPQPVSAEGESPRLAPVGPHQVLRANRYADNRDDLWTTFNRVQENLTQGGLRGRAASGRRIRTQPVTGIDQNTNLNRALWQLAEGMARLKGVETAVAL